MATKMTDKYPQFMKLSVTMSVADTLEFSQVSLGISMFDYAALLLTRIEYSPGRATIQNIVANTDVIWMGLTGSDSLASLSLEQPQVYDLLEIYGNLVGAAGNMSMMENPIIHDFTGLSGGGLLVPAQDMYLAMSTAGMAGAPGSGTARLYYQVQKLQAADYIELAQRLRVLST